MRINSFDHNRFIFKIEGDGEEAIYIKMNDDGEGKGLIFGYQEQNGHKMEKIMVLDS